MGTSGHHPSQHTPDEGKAPKRSRALTRDLRTWLRPEEYRELADKVRDLYDFMYPDEARETLNVFEFVALDRTRVELAYKLIRIRYRFDTVKEFRTYFARHGADPEMLEEFIRIVWTCASPSERLCMEQAGLFRGKDYTDFSTYTQEIEEIRKLEFRQEDYLITAMNQAEENRRNRLLDQWISRQGPDQPD